MTQKKIIVVDDSEVNLKICTKALGGTYEVYPALSAEIMFDILSHIKPDLILLDVEMPGIHGYDAMRQLKGNDLYKDIPVIFLSAMDDTQSEIIGFELGAVDYIHKPFIDSILLKRVDTNIAQIDAANKLSMQGKYNDMAMLHESIAHKIEKTLQLDDIDEINQILHSIDAELKNFGVDI